jgi:hypothetical protein
MRNLFLMEVDPNQRAVAMRAVKSALIAAGMDHADAIYEAQRQVLRVLQGRGPVGLVVEDGAEVPAGAVDAAAVAFADALADHPDAAAVEVDYDYEAPQTPPEAPETPRQEVAAIDSLFEGDAPADFTPSPAAWRTALTLVSFCDGSETRAWFLAKTLARQTGDPALWVEVNHLLTDTFMFSKIKT